MIPQLRGITPDTQGLTPGAGTVGLVELAELLKSLWVQLDERDWAAFGAQDNFAVDHHNRAFSNTAFAPHFFAGLEVYTGKGATT